MDKKKVTAIDTITGLIEINEMEKRNLQKLMELIRTEEISPELEVEFRKIEVKEKDPGDRNDGYYREPNLSPDDSPQGIELEILEAVN